ncbi:DUF5979 domain-containing protein [uncultured Schumannella sp.]|uniref:DUF5979 domain-containing protein n=1 Tax=uncultured Schumannella sp. TaxID=1195956 RepID=UPI0025F65A1D|nr:DUF5979 domain-containing protein [uncultured Schumannella sp.]
MFTSLRRRRRSTHLALLAGALVGLLSSFVATPALAAEGDAEPAYVTLIKSATPAPPEALAPGDLVTFNFSINCSSDVSDCVGLQVSDALPDPLELQNVSISGSAGVGTAEGTFETTEDSFVLTFTNDLGGDRIGLPDGFSVDFVATGRVPLDAPADFDGATIENIAYATLDYEPSNTSDNAFVLLEIPTSLDTTVAKSATPSSVAALSGTEVDFVLTAENASNTAVDALIVQDPASTADDPFAYLAPETLVIEEWPSDADRVQVDWFDGAAWQLGTPTASPSVPTPGEGEEIAGLRFTFTNSAGGTIERGAAAEITLGSELRDNVSDISGSALVDNTASSWVQLDAETSTPQEDSASVRLNEVSVRPLAEKTFTPNSIVGGRDVEVELRGDNGGDFALAELTLQEPAAGELDLLDQGLSFEAWLESDIEWPVGATSAEVSFWYDGDADFSTPSTVSPSDALPAPEEESGDVRGVRVSFLGSMNPGEYAVLAYTAGTSAVASDVTTTNTISVESVTVGADPLVDSTTAEDDLTRRTARVNAVISKTARPSSLYALLGARSVISITAGVAPAPSTASDDSGSTVGATRFVVTDPVGAGADFWDSFELTRILATDIPAGSQLTVEYLDISSTPVWTELSAAQTGPALYSRTLSEGERANFGGIRFVYEPVGQDELPPGFSVQINLRTALLVGGIDDEATENYDIDNVARATVENEAATPTSASRDAVESVTLQPVEGSVGGVGGEVPLIDKSWLENELTGFAVNARSSEHATATLSWGTAGLEFDSVVISDSAVDPAVAGYDVADTVYDAFDLVEIPRITTAMDPLLRYDAIVGFELYLAGTGWVAPASDPCADDACDGEFPGYTLTSSEQALAEGVRFIFEESPTRDERIDASDSDDPPVGSGVAATVGFDREIDLVFEVRDERRSNGDPVLGSTRGTSYNASNAGWVENSALLEARADTGEVLYTDQATDEIEILDRPLNVTVSKLWTDGPLGVPPTGTAAELFPEARITIEATNATVARVDSLSVVEPAIEGEGTTPDPFDFVDLVDIVSISTPLGTTTSTVMLEPAASYPTPYTVAEALALTAAELADATGIRIEHEGRIESAASTRIVLDTRLREFQRSSPTTRVDDTASPVVNSVVGTVSDAGGTVASGPAPAPGDILSVSDAAEAGMVIEAFEADVVAAKSITAGTAATESTPAIQYDGGSTEATVELTGRPAGNVRYTDMIVEDTSATFWNAYVFSGFSAHTLTSPIDRVQVDALVDVTYGTGAGNSITSSGGTWELGTPGTSLALPAGVDPADVRGLRFTYTRADGASWEHPSNPQQSVSFTVERRDDLLTGGPVPSTLYIYDTGIAPGETERATFTNEVEVTVNARETPESPATWTATDEDTKQLRFEHLPAKVQIHKSPSGPISLGDTIDFSIEVTNFGEEGDRVLSGLVVTDLLPVDGSGDAYLVFPENPDSDEPYDPNDPADAAEIFSFELRDESGTLQPTPTVGVALDTVETGAPGIDQPRLTFTLAGTLPLGWTLTIGSPMEFRPLLEAGTQVTNTATVVSDREFDSCGSHFENDAEVDPGSIDGDVPPYVETSSCFSETTVWPLPSAPLTIVKGVKGIDAGPLAADGETVLLDGEGDPYDDLGVAKVSATNPTDCSVSNTTLTVNGGGYYRYPCVPVTRPGSEHEWAASFTNSGNVSVRQIVAIDVLPQPDDTGVTISSSRNSQWTPTLSSYPQASGLPTGATLTVYYTDDATMATSQCNGADIQSTMGMTPTTDPPMLPAYQDCLTDTGAATDLPNREWTILPNDPAVWATVAALKFVVLMDDGDELTHLLPPASSISITYRSTTALVPEVVNPSSTLARDSVAYNSIAGAATGRVYPEGEEPLDLAYRLVTEPRKSGVALAVGSVELLKENEGAAASYAPSAVELELSCEVEGESIPLLDANGDDRSTVSVTPGTVTSVEGLPLYAECAVAEADDYGQTSVVRDPSPTELIAHAAHAEGDWSISNPVPAFDEGEDTFRPAVELATVTNTYASASLTVGKTVETNGAVNQSDVAIVYTAPVFSVSCTFDNGVSNPVIFSVTGISIASGSSVTFPRAATSDPVLPAGAVCTVTETNTRNATTTTYTVTTDEVAGTETAGAAATVTLTPDDEGATTNSVAFANEYGVGSFTVTKSIAGLGAAEYGTGDFTVSVTCTRASASPTQVWTGTFTFNASNTTETVNNLPAGSVCTVTETDAAGATSTTFSPQRSGVPAQGRATVPNGSAATVAITNTFDLARLSITKDVHSSAVDSEGAPVSPGDDYDFEVVCTWQGEVRLADGFTESPMLLEDVEPDETRTLTGLPAGASCAITETNIPAQVDSTSIEWTTASGSSSATGATATVTLTADSSPTAGTNTATVVNRYDVGSLTVTKSVRGDAGAQFGTGPFLIAVDCVAPGSITAFDDTISLPTAGGAWFVTIEDLPEGSVCSVDETNAASSGADATRMLDADDEIFDGTGIAISADDPAEVTIENWYLTGAITVGKEIEGSAAATYGDGPFEFTVACTVEVDGDDVVVTGFPKSETLAEGETVTFTGLPSGADCTLTESDAGGASSSRVVVASDHSTELSADAVTGYDFTVTVDAAELTDDQPQTAVDIINEFRLAGLVVTKTVQSDAVDQDGNPIEYGPFDVTVECTFDDEEIYASGFSASTPMAHSSSEGDDPWVLSGLVAGASCEITETDRVGSSSSRITTTPSDGTSSTALISESSDSVSHSIVLVDRVDGAEENTAAIRNDYESGSVRLQKALDGLGTAWATDEFEIQVTCTLADGPVESTVWDESYVFDPSELVRVTLSGVASGAECEIEEIRTGGANSTAITIDSVVTDGASVTIESPSGSTPLDVLVTNVFDLAEIAIDKDRSGDAETVAAYGVGPFEVTATCTRDIDGTEVSVDIPGGATRELTALGSYRATYTGLPADADCDIAETRTGGANTSLVSPSSLSLASGSNDVLVTNEFTAGSLTVTKERLGDGVALYGAGPFYVSLSCTREVDGTAVAVAIPAPSVPIDGISDPAIRELSLAGAYTAEYTNLPTGAECELSESGTGGASASSLDHSEFVVGDGTTESIEVTNEFRLVSLTVTNKVTGNASEPKLDDDFVIVLECWLDVNGVRTAVEIPGGPVRDFKHTETVEYLSLPVGAECRITETDDRGANRVSIEHEGSDVDLFTLELPPLPDGVSVRGPSDSVIDILVINVFVADLALTGVAGLWAAVWALVAIVVGAVVIAWMRGREAR